MKTGPKILHEIPDLDELAGKHQNFDALMDAYTDEKVRKRKKLYRLASFALVIVATAFLSWLYWGLESTDSASETSQRPVEQIEEQPAKAAITVDSLEKEKVEKPAEKVVEAEVKNEVKETPAQKQESAPKEPVSDEEQVVEPEVIATPEVQAITVMSQDAAPVAGLEHLYKYLYNEITLPDSLLKYDDSLFLEVGFEVGKAGEISNITFSKELPVEVSQLLKKVFAEMPVWSPAIEKGDSVVSVINLPITFQKKKTK